MASHGSAARSDPVEWMREGEVALPPSADGGDALRALRPTVLHETDGGSRMWYTGDDGTTSRIVAAIRPPDGDWTSLGVALSPGAAGETDSYGVESPCVVATPGGYVMAYGGFDGEVTRLHIATSADGRAGGPPRPLMQRGEAKAS